MIYDILARRDGTLPRRIVLLDSDTIADKVDHPRREECHILSSIAECVRRERGHLIYSRDPVTLLTQCLDHSILSEDAWLAFCDDLECELVTSDHVELVFTCHPSRAIGFYTAILGSPNITHATAVVRVLAFALPHMPAPSIDALSEAINHDLHQGLAFFDHCVRLIKTLPVAEGLRDKAYEVFGKTLLTDHGVAAALSNALLESLELPLAGDIITLMLGSSLPLGKCVHDIETLLQRLAEHMPSIPHPRRAPFFKFAARVLGGYTPSSQVHQSWMTLVEGAMRDKILAVPALQVLKALEPVDTLLGLVLRHV